MHLSVNWLREFVPYEGSTQELCDRLTMMGLEVEEIIRPFAALEGVVVGHVVSCEKHPDADTLSLCTVDHGQGEAVQVVCGAPNVAKGQKIAFAPVGTTLPSGMTLKKVKLRGQASHGMICAEDELGLGEDHSGIMVLDPGLAVGAPLTEALALDDVVFDIGVTPNRADCLSVLGLAREVGIAFNLPVGLPEISLQEDGAPASEFVRVQIDDPELCPAYRARILEGMAVGPAPAWMRYRLIAVGQRPISNVVDVTNYVMFELGQPLHAFDLDLIEGGMIRVAPAQEGMRFTTLDNQERVLTAQDLLIWDGVKPVALAGVMGGANSEINSQSSRVLLESAVFRPGTIRKTARRLTLPSEASYRFERGVDQPGSLLALDRAAQLLAAHCGGTLRPGVSQAEPRPWAQQRISFRPERARKLLGLPLEDAFCAQVVGNMGCDVQQRDNGAWEVGPPSHRLDLEREVDIIEELGRVYGADRIPATLPKVSRSLNPDDAPPRVLTSKYPFSLGLKRWAAGAGLNEAVNYSFVGQRDLDRLNLDTEDRIPVKNPLTDEQDVLRTVLAPGLLQTLRHNLAQGNDRLRLFELAHVFHADPDSETTAREPARLGLLLHGSRWEETWPWKQEDADYQDLKGLVEHLLEHLKLPKGRFSLVQEHPWMKPCVNLEVEGRVIGQLGRVLPEIADAHHARKDVWMAELDADILKELAEAVTVAFHELPKFPPVRRDITLAAPMDLPVGHVLEHIEGLNLPLLENVLLLDVFVPESQPEDGEEERKLTFRMTFRHANRTLTDKDVDKEMQKMSQSLVKNLPLRL